MRAIISAGGTGGHLYPALAVGDALRSSEEDADILIVTGLSELERDLVKKSGFKLAQMDVPGLRRKLSPELISAVFKVSRGITNASHVIKEFDPDIVLGFGGAVTYPLIRGAQKLGVPTLIQEQNVVPGLANKYLSRSVDVVAVSAEETKAYLTRAGRIVVTGTPIRTGHLKTTRNEARRELNLDESSRVVTVFGGSQGAKHVNETTAAAYSGLAAIPNLMLLHITGKRDFTEIAKLWSKAGAPPQVKLLPYLDDMGWAYRASDLVVCRAGASTLAELGAYGVPALLIPYPYASNDHQAKNAAALAAAGAAAVVANDELSAELLTDTVRALLDDREELRAMAGRMKKTGRADAARDVADLAMSLVRRRQGGTG